MASLRELANCIEAPASFSVLRDFFGFIQERVPADPADPTDPDWQQSRVSLLQRMQLLQGDYYNVNVIAVGWDNFTTNPTFGEMYDRADYAVYRSHEIYAQRSIGVGRVRYWYITSEDADGLDILDNDAELDELADQWSVDNDGIDVFIVFMMNMGGLLGRSDICGPCDGVETDSDDELCDTHNRDASVVNPRGAEDFNGNAGLGMARTFAHENGHYLGLRHPNNQASFPLRLMTQTGSASSLRDSVELTNNEGNICRNHCSIQEGC
ncbi:MAG: hypothetical protein F6K04_12285 [Leptolyngbya sp. SIO4C5]|nr:hypothetical protein [Leptolyngbya sp. SIO4C5]